MGGAKAGEASAFCFHHRFEREKVNLTPLLAQAVIARDGTFVMRELIPHVASGSRSGMSNADISASYTKWQLMNDLHH